MNHRARVLGLFRAVYKSVKCMLGYLPRPLSLEKVPLSRTMRGKAERGNERTNGKLPLDRIYERYFYVWISVTGSLIRGALIDKVGVPFDFTGGHMPELVP